MFNNVGGKIKALVQVTFVMTCVAAGLIVLIFFMIACDNGGGAWLGFLFSILGAAVLIFFSWIGSFVLYGYGELVDTNQKIEKHLERLAGTAADKFEYEECEDSEECDDTSYPASVCLGVSGKCITSEFAGENNIPIKGIRVTYIDEEMSVASSELCLNDIIVKIEGNEITQMTDVTREVIKHKAGDVVEMDVYRQSDDGTYVPLKFGVIISAT